MAIYINKVLQARLFTVLIVVILSLLATAVLLLRDINASNWQEEILTQYFPMLVIPAACIYLIILAMRVHKLEHAVTVAGYFDSLTHTLKTKPLLKQAEKVYKSTNLKDRPISVLCLGVDRVSAIEDEYGEEAAKAVLREFGGTIIGATREDDLIGRYEENIFIAVVMNTPNEYALPVVARFQELAHADVVLVDDAEVRYSVCVGYASSNQKDEAPDFNTLFKQALSALESAKKEGPASVQGWLG